MVARLCRLLVPVAILVALVAVYRVACVRPAAEPPLASRAEPWTIAPRYDDPRVATDEQLASVLDRLQPPIDPINTNTLVHALRLWGSQARFDDPRLPSGETMRQYFLDYRVFRHLAGEQSPLLYYRDADGLAVRSFEEAKSFRRTSSYHLDDLLATLAETGTPTAAPLILPEEQATVGELLTDSVRRYHLERFEYEWTAIVYARYLFPLPAWKNKYGETITREALIRELVSLPPGHGQCAGLHRLEALVLLCRADDEAHALTPRERELIVRHLAHMSQLLVASQNPDGSWTRKWPAGAAGAADKDAPQGDRILATGHHLEWLALAPEEALPPRETIVRAGQWLVRAMAEIDPKSLSDRYGPFSHAARALCLWRSQEPYEAWRRGHPAPAALSAAGE